ncbi:site-specific integrase [Kinneretia aquatilis]|nr:site-specific integrase [Paucibacter aquatile]
MATRRPARLQLNRHGVFSFRWIVPTRLRDEQGKPREIRVSLRTRDARHARILAMSVNLALERICEMSSNIDPRDLLQQMTLQAGDLKIDIKDLNDLTLFNELLKAQPQLKDMLEKAAGSLSDPQAIVRTLSQSVVKAAGQPAFGSIKPQRLTAAVDEYIESRDGVGRNSESTGAEKKRSLDSLTMFLKRSLEVDISKTHAHELTRATLLRFVNFYAKYGAVTSDAVWDKTVEGKDTGKGKDGRPAKSHRGVAARTLLKAIGHLEDFCTYCVTSEVMASNPIDEDFRKALKGIKDEAATARKHNGYRPFSPDQLKLIFDPEKYLAANSAADYFWCALIALFTAARLGEIVTLTLADIYVDPASGVLVFRIREDEESGRRVKNKNSERIVPVSRRLIEIGFWEYVEHAHTLGALTLFPHLKQGATRASDPSKNQSRRFADYLTDLGITDEDLVFHSFRHTAITTMLGRGVPPMDSELIAGHAAQDLAMRAESISGARRTWSTTQASTYAHATLFAEEGEPLLKRLQRHVDHALDFNLDYLGLRSAAEIVRKNTTKQIRDGAAVFKSGWHTNAKDYAQQMLDEFRRSRAVAAATTPGDSDTAV